MKYAEHGNLKKNLSNIVKSKWLVKLEKLYFLIFGLNNIHQQNLIHCDFHHGNILFDYEILFISDLGLCSSLLSMRPHYLYIQLK